MDAAQIVSIILSGGCFAFVTLAWIRELLFYRRHNWDFDQEIKGPVFYWSESMHPSAMMTNSDRLKKGYPFAVLLTLGLLLGTIFVMGK